MSSIPEPMRPAYVAGESSVVMGSDAGIAKSASAAKSKKTSRSHVKKYASQAQKKSSKSTKKGARSLVRAAYEPLRRVVKGDSAAREERRVRSEKRADGAREASSARQAKARKSGTTQTVYEFARNSEGAANAQDAVAVPVQVIDAPQTTGAASANEVATVVSAVSAAVNSSSGLAVVTQSDADLIKTAEVRVRESLQKYEAAMRQMEVRFEVLDRDISLKKNRNPIHHIESRVKKPASIIEKLQRQGFPVSVESMEENLFDIAGVRVICSYISDVYNLLDLMKKQDDLEIVTIKDYIANPKPNGYRSLHVIVRMPVYFMDKKEMVPVEVQLRTIAMDFWASLEHSLKYKAVREVQGIDASDELKDCSRIIEDVEARMQILARALEEEE